MKKETSHILTKETIKNVYALICNFDKLKGKLFKRMKLEPFALLLMTNCIAHANAICSNYKPTSACLW